MSDILCSYKDREAALMAYLYDEIAPQDRTAFEAHLTTCARCRVELNGLDGVRAQLADWAPPDFRDSQPLVVSRPSSVASRASAITSGPSSVTTRADERRASFWSEMPVWAQAAAALLVVGVSAGAANLNIHYDAQSGLNVRTGWSSQPSTERVAQSVAAQNTDAVTRTELAALEQQLRSEIQAAATSPSPVPSGAQMVANSGPDARRFKMLLDETERRHEREMALRIAEVVRDVNAQRQADLVKIDQNLGLIDRRNDIEVRRNRQMIDMYLKTVSQRQ
jgi:anti-sigma factor RsiW